MREETRLQFVYAMKCASEALRATMGEEALQSKVTYASEASQCAASARQQVEAEAARHVENERRRLIAEAASHIEAERHNSE